jgi:hypothetical protein
MQNIQHMPITAKRDNMRGIIKRVLTIYINKLLQARAGQIMI